MAATKAKRRPGGGGAAVIIGNKIAAEPTATSSKEQAGPAALGRACLSCGSPSVIGLCGSCEMERELGRLCDSVVELAQLLASEAGPSALRLPVRLHQCPKPRLRLSRPELELAPECTRQAARDLDGWWWEPTDALPAIYVEASVTWGAGMSAPRTLAEARAAFVPALLRCNGPFGLFPLAEEQEYWHERGLTLRQRDEAIDHLVATGQAHLRVDGHGVWLEIGAPS